MSYVTTAEVRQKLSEAAIRNAELNRPKSQIRNSEAFREMIALSSGSRFCRCEARCGAIVPLLARETHPVGRMCCECREVRVDLIMAARRAAA